MKYGKSPLIGILQAIENIKIALWAKRNLKKPHISYEDYKNHPEVKEAVDQLIKKVNEHYKPL
jgi:hypothetical protein